MIWKNKLIILSLFALGCSVNLSEKEIGYFSVKHLIEAEELSDRLNDSNVKILDIRRETDYQNAHIDGANFLWRNELEDTTYSYAGMRPTKRQLEELLGKKGIKSDDFIVLYDNIGACDAARVWWALKLYGHEKMAILNGGLKAWVDFGGSVTDVKPVIQNENFVFSNRDNFNLLIEREDFQSSLLLNKSVLLDARSSDEFFGSRQKKGASRSGRIPNSMNIEWVNAINFGGDMKFRTIEELKENYKAVIETEGEIIVYCHSGVRSAHTLFVLTELLGLQNVRNYDGSWTEWSYFKELPIESDSIAVMNL